MSEEQRGKLICFVYFVCIDGWRFFLVFIRFRSFPFVIASPLARERKRCSGSCMRGTDVRRLLVSCVIVWFVVITVVRQYTLWFVVLRCALIQFVELSLFPSSFVCEVSMYLVYLWSFPCSRRLLCVCRSINVFGIFDRVHESFSFCFTKFFMKCQSVIFA